MKQKNVFLAAMALAVIGTGLAGCNKGPAIRTGAARTWQDNVLREEAFTDSTGYPALHVTLYLPELDQSMRYEACQGEAAEVAVKIVEEYAAGGETTIIDNTANLAPTVKEYMRNRNVRFMYFEVDGVGYVNIREADPEKFFFAANVGIEF